MRIIGFFLLFVNLISTVVADDDNPKLIKPKTTNVDHPRQITPNMTSSQRISEKLDEPRLVKVSKCCPDHQSLDLSIPKQHSCVDVPDHDSPFVRIKGLDLDNNNQTEVQIQLNKDQRQPSMPSCFSTGFEVHKIENFGIKTMGNKRTYHHIVSFQHLRTFATLGSQ